MKKSMNKPEKKEIVVFTPEQKSAYKKICNQISGSVRNLENNYIKLAVALATAHSEKLYEIGGFQNVYDFAKERYNLSRGTVSKYIGLVSVFGLSEESKPLYSSTQMMELLPYVRSGGSLDNFSPDMSKNEIRKKIKELSSPAPSLTQGKKVSPAKQVLMSLTCEEEFQAQVDGLLALILQSLEEGSSVQIVSIPA